jgi:GT2 family glycosyltransferase
MTVDAVIPQWNRSDLLRTLLENLKLQTRRFDRIFVVDNGSRDNSVEVARAGGAAVLELGSNVGFAAAVNRAVARSGADWVAILNNDVTLEPNWLDTLLESAGENHVGKPWFATGKLLEAGNPKILDGAFDEISRGACACRCGAGKPDAPFWNRARKIRMAPMTALLVRRRLFDEIGFLDESFGSYLEDVDFGLRCALAGCAGIYVPSAVGYHLGSATSGKWNPDTCRLIARNQILLAAKHFRGQPWLPILAGQLLWGLVALRHGRGLAYLQGKWAGLRLIRRIGRQRAAEPAAVGQIIRESERDLVEIQRQTGFDAYWRAYFWLFAP